MKRKETKRYFNLHQNTSRQQVRGKHSYAPVQSLMIYLRNGHALGTCRVVLYSPARKIWRQDDTSLCPSRSPALVQPVRSSTLWSKQWFPSLSASQGSGHRLYRTVLRSWVIYPCRGSWCDFAIPNPVSHYSSPKWNSRWNGDERSEAVGGWLGGWVGEGGWADGWVCESLVWVWVGSWMVGVSAYVSFIYVAFVILFSFVAMCDLIIFFNEVFYFYLVVRVDLSTAGPLYSLSFSSFVL